MRWLAWVAVGLVVAQGSAAVVGPAAADPRLVAATAFALELRDAPWSERFAMVQALEGQGRAAPVAFVEARPVAAIVASVYARLGASLAEEDAQRMDRMAQALPPAAAHALQQLLGAVDEGMADWALAVAPWTAEDWSLLAAQEAGTQGPPEVQAVLAKADGAALQRSAMRLLGVVEAVLPALRGIEAQGPAPEVFPGPNEGVLFNDPFNLILVGATGPSVYRGNTFPFTSIDRSEHALILELGGDDRYLLHAASAHPLPTAGVCLGTCHNGLPASVVIDVAGTDLYSSTTPGGNAGHGVLAGLGLLLDAGGNDRYASSTGTSQGWGGLRGLGILLEGGGNDVYIAPSSAQGAAVDYGSLGMLIDHDGDDSYAALAGSQGSGVWGGGVAIDLRGNDRVVSGSLSQGSSAGGGSGLFLNLLGNDVYGAQRDTRGHADGCAAGALCGLVGLEHSAMFLDLCGQDVYGGWLGADDSTWHQGTLGLGVDLAPPGCG